MTKNLCYIYWDDTSIAEENREIRIQCTACFKANRKGIRWPGPLHGKNTIKCNSCNTIIYEKTKKNNNNEQKNEDQATI